MPWKYELFLIVIKPDMVIASILQAGILQVSE